MRFERNGPSINVVNDEGDRCSISQRELCELAFAIDEIHKEERHTKQVYLKRGQVRAIIYKAGSEIPAEAAFFK